MTLAQPDLNYLFEFVYRRSAIVLNAEKAYLVEGRLGPLAKAEGFRSIEAMIAALRTGPASGLHTAVVEAMTTNETTFFRDHHPFESLKQDLVPALRQARGLSRSLTILSAACSTGQEAYSVAMLLTDHFPDLESWSIRIIGVDLAESVLTKARSGTYHQAEVNRGLPAAFLVKYFDRVGTEWQIKKTLRDKVEFKQMNLIESWPVLPRVDIFFLRNVLIYFDMPTKKAILTRARQAMAPDGYLLLGGAETTINVDESFQRVQLGKSVVYRPGPVGGKA